MSDSIKNYLKSNTFKNKNVIVTGANGAIGSEVVKKLLECGANVVGFIHNQSENDDFFLEYKKSNKLHFITTELKYGQKVTDQFKEAMIKLKGRLDILICCHGKFFYGNVIDTDANVFDENININVRANFQLLSLSVPFLKISKGNAVMISSIDTKIVEKGDFLHALNKSMINSLVQNSALELASFGVRINAVAPSFVKSNYRSINNDLNNNDKFLEMIKEYNLLNKKNIEPENVADAILFLASDEASFMTGEIMTIDNGFELNHDLSFMDGE
jgi:Tropinone reductase 1